MSRKILLSSFLAVVLWFLLVIPSLGETNQEKEERVLSYREGLLIERFKQFERSLQADMEDSLVAEVETEAKKENSRYQVQLFEESTHNLIMNTGIDSLKDLGILKFSPPQELSDKHKYDSYYQVDYSLVISTAKRTGVYDFSEFYVNDFGKLNQEQLYSMLDYVTANGLDMPLKLKFLKNENEIKELKSKRPGDVSDQCIACVGYIYSSTSYETKWTDIAQVHAIKGVDTTFSFSTTESSSGSIQVKTVTSGGSVETSGSKSVTFTEETIFPLLTGSYLNTQGRIAQTQVKYAKSLYKHPNGNQYTKVSAYNHVGGAQWGSYVGGNGASWTSVTGPEYVAGSSTTITQSSTVTFTAAVGFTIHGVGISLNTSTLSTTQNKWNFKFKSGYGYSRYKIYNKGTKNNLTAR